MMLVPSTLIFKGLRRMLVSLIDISVDEVLILGTTERSASGHVPQRVPSPRELWEVSTMDKTVTTHFSSGQS